MAGVFFPLIWLADVESRRGWVGLFQEELGEDEDLKGEDEAGHPSKEVDIGFGVADFEFEPVFDGFEICLGASAVFGSLEGKLLSGRYDVGFCCGLRINELGQGGDLLVGETGFA